jgi:predicted TIM-barrel fold metal-dependent hydrolase
MSLQTTSATLGDGRHLVISADGHAFGPGNGVMDTGHLTVLSDYVEPRYRPDYADYVQHLQHEGTERMARVLGGLFDKNAPRSFAEQAAESSTGTRGLFDSRCRVKELEDDGIVAEVIFPNGVPFGHSFGGPAYSPELRAAGARAYNRWLADFCSEEPGRRAGMAVIPLHDVEEAVKQVGAAKEAGLRGVLLPAYWATEGIPPYLDAYYEPFWSTCAEAGMPLNVHGGASIGDVDMETYGMPAMLTYATETTFLSTRSLAQLIWGGVFERHPDLVFVLTESRADWVPARLAFLDGVYDDQLFAHVKDTVKHKPSEYWNRQCYVAASFMSRDEALLRHRIGLDRLLWGADYPHYEGTWPHTERWLKEALGGVPTAEVRTILAENPAKVFGFDLEALAPHAERVGPRIDDLERYQPSGKLWRW